jgi:predicted nuclease of predicted toxin-antitoxin system
VRFKLDENLPSRAAAPLQAAGHDVDTVAEEGLAGAVDAAVLEAATTAHRLIVTLDRGFADVRAYPAGSHAGVLVLRVEDQSPEAIAREIESLLERVDLETLGGCVAIYRAGSLRVRRSSP